MNLGVLQALTTVALTQAQEPWTGTIPTLINEALKQIQMRRSFNCNKRTIAFTLNVSGPGPFTYDLPAEYKELQSGPHPLRNTNQAGYFGSLWRIFDRQEVNRLNMSGLSLSDRTAWIEQSSTGQWTIYFPGPLNTGILPPITEFEVDTYCFLPAVVNLTDENDLMAKYPMLVLEYAKFLVFSLGSDEASIKAKLEALRMIDGSGDHVGYFARASADDNSRQMRGRTARWGGF